MNGLVLLVLLVLGPIVMLLPVLLLMIGARDSHSAREA
jgi:hypothetical protein